MKIVIVINRLYDLNGEYVTLGGIQTYLINLCRVINENFSIKPYIYQCANNEFVVNGSDYIVKGVYKGNGTSDINAVVDSVIKDFDPRETVIIWGSDQYSQKIKSFKSINIQHGIGFDTEAMESVLKKLVLKLHLGWLYKFLQRFNARKLVSNGDTVVCVDYNFNNWIRTYTSSLEDRMKYKVIPNFTKSLPEISKKKSFNKILVARRFVRRRGISLAVQVAEIVIAEYRDIEFTFAGDGPELGLVQSLKEKYPDNVVITKYSQGESLAFHSKYDIALIPSIGSEGTSLSLLEAMGAGCLPIATNVGGMTNIIIDNYNGYLVEPCVESIVTAIEESIENNGKSNELIYAAWCTARQGFNVELWGKKWVAVINELFHSR